MMKNVISFVLICLVAFITGCTNKVVEPGEVGIYVDKPIFFGTGGVRDEPHGVGRVITWATTDIVTVTTAPQSFTVHVDDMMTSNKVPLDFDIAVTLEMTDLKVAPSALMRRFSGGPVTAFAREMMPDLDMNKMFANNPSGEFMSALRDEVRQKHMDSFLIATDGNGNHLDANKDIEEKMVKYSNEFLAKEGAPVRVKNVALGRANPPNEIKSAGARTAEQIQAKTTEKAREQAQIARKAAETASADADHAQQTRLGFTNDQYLTKLYLETVLKVCGSSSKDLNDSGGGSKCTVIFGQALPTLPVH